MKLKHFQHLQTHYYREYRCALKTNFQNMCPKDHNDICATLARSVGEETGLLSPIEEKESVEKHFKNKQSEQNGAPK